MNIGRNSVSVLEELHHVGWRPLHKCNVMSILRKLNCKLRMVVTPKGSLIFGACIGSN